MRLPIIALCILAAAAPASAQTHARHTAAHDSAHAIMLDDAQHLALHKLLLGHWAGDFAHDTVHVRFEQDAEHQQLMVRHQTGVVGFQIRGDTISWKQSVAGEGCVIAAPVSALLELTKADASKSPSVSVAITCGEKRAPLTLRKIVSG
jgi:hypothetical protein